MNFIIDCFYFEHSNCRILLRQKLVVYSITEVQVVQIFIIVALDPLVNDGTLPGAKGAPQEFRFKSTRRDKRKERRYL